MKIKEFPFCLVLSGVPNHWASAMGRPGTDMERGREGMAVAEAARGSQGEREQIVLHSLVTKTYQRSVGRFCNFCFACLWSYVMLSSCSGSCMVDKIILGGM